MGFRVTVLREIMGPWNPEPPICIASDLHGGDGSGADDFTRLHRLAFEWFLDHEIEGRSTLILAGDVWELWQCAWKDILFTRPQNFRCLGGNHDSSRRNPPHWEEWFWPYRVAPNLLVEHGHRADPLNSSLGLVGWGVSALAGLLERLGWEDVDEKAWRWKWMPTPVTRPSRFPPEHYPDYAGRRAKETGAGIVVLGHTHRPMLVERPWGIYANCGCWVRPEFLGSFVRIGDGAISLCKVT